MLIMICLSAATIATIITTLRVVMNSKHWAVYFVSTVMRSGFALM